jgi:hypothetical protein
MGFKERLTLNLIQLLNEILGLSRYEGMDGNNGIWAIDYRLKRDIYLST